MAKLLQGRDVAEAVNRRTAEMCQQLKAQNIFPALAVIRCGEREDDLSYERGLLKRAEALSVGVKQVIFPEDADKADLLAAIAQLNTDPTVHGVLLFRPLPAHLRSAEREICNHLIPEKDVDGMTDLSAAGVYMGQPLGFPPCTPRACLEILDHYGIDCTGKSAAVIGRSLVVGRPAAMLLMGRNSTVTICHTRTKDLPAVTRQADIILSAAGVSGSLRREHVRPGQVVLDVSMNWDETQQRLVGDADFEALSTVVEAITPVPGGVGAVTTAVLMSHVVEAARRLYSEQF